MNQLTESFSRARAENRALLIGYLPAGFPDFESSLLAIETLVTSGADVVEIGLPYSDPLMDGPVIQRAVEAALANGITTSKVLELAAEATKFGAPIWVMSYWNPIERFGLERFARTLSAGGGVGVITPDLTPEEATPWVETTNEFGLSRVFLVAPTTTPDRVAEIASVTNGFIYAASLMGVTGVRDQVASGPRTDAGQSDRAFDLVQRIKEVSDTPVAVGIGISSAQQVKATAVYANGVIVGSLLVKTIAEAIDSNSGDFSAAVRSLAPLVAELAAATKGTT